MMKTAEKVRRLRRGHGLTQVELSQKTGISQGTISDIESGASRVPHPKTLKALADALGVSGMELLDDPGEA